MHVVFIYGPAAAGKHTVGSALSAELGIPLFHNHLTVDLALSLFEFGSTGFKNLRAEVWRLAFGNAAKDDVSFIFTFQPEASVEPSLVEDLGAQVRASGGTVFFVELVCSHATVLSRLGAESRRQFGKLTDTDLYEQIHAAGGFDFEGMPPADIRIDTDSVPPIEAARMIAEALQVEGLT
jgi:hypothetical protein